MWHNVEHSISRFNHDCDDHSRGVYMATSKGMIIEVITLKESRLFIASVITIEIKRD